MAGAGAFQTIMGGIQMIRGMRMKPERPTYQRPEEVNQMMGMLQREANAKAPGITQAEANLRQAGAQAMQSASENATSGAAALAAGAGVNSRMNQGYRDLSANAEQYRRQSQQALLQGYQQAAQYSDREFELNKYQPFMEASATKAALTQAGMQNIPAGMNAMGNAAIAGMYAQGLQNTMNAPTGNGIPFIQGPFQQGFYNPYNPYNLWRG